RRMFCAMTTRSPKRRRCCCQRRATLTRSMMAKNGGSSAASWRASCSIWGMPAQPIGWSRRGPSRPRKTRGSNAISWRAGAGRGFLDDPETAATHFKRIQDVTRHPTSHARSHYWLGRVAEALHQPEQARAEYETAARGSAAYYGQLARARLGLPALALAPPPP